MKRLIKNKKFDIFFVVVIGAIYGSAPFEKDFLERIDMIYWPLFALTMFLMITKMLTEDIQELSYENLKKHNTRNRNELIKVIEYLVSELNYPTMSDHTKKGLMIEVQKLKLDLENLEK